MQQRSMIGTAAKWGLGIFAALVLLFMALVAAVVLVSALNEPVASSKGRAPQPRRAGRRGQS